MSSSSNSSPSTPGRKAAGRATAGPTTPPSELGGAGTAVNSPASATKTAALTRKASSAKRASMNGLKAGPAAGIKANNEARASRRSGSISMGRGSSGNSSNSANGSSDADSVIASYATADELSRMTRDQLVALITRERSEKDELEAKLVSLSEEHATLNGKHDELVRSQVLHETKLQEAHDTASRFENELAEQASSLDAQRAQLRDLEKEGRDAQKRYAEQIEAFNAERLGLQEMQKTLQDKLSKVQQDLDLALAEKHSRHASGGSVAATPMTTTDSHLGSTGVAASGAPASPMVSIPVGTLEELQRLQGRVTELEGDQSTLTVETQRLQAEVEELQRYTSDLQEQNENYEVLLGERMLNGFGTLSDSGFGTSTGNGSRLSSASMPSGESSEGGRSRPTSSLGALEEHADEEIEGRSDQDATSEHLEALGHGDLEGGAVGARQSIIRTPKRSNQRDSTFGSGALDLEAELSRANQDEEKQKAEEARQERKAKSVAERRKENQSQHLGGREGDPISSDLETLRKEVKLLRQENKGLTTYVSKILERVIGLEGFEKVLAVDRDFKQSPPMAPQNSNQGTRAVPPLPSRPSPLRAQTSIAATTVTPGPVSPTAALHETTAGSNAKKSRFSMSSLTSALWRSSTTATPAAAAAAAAAGSSAGANGFTPGHGKRASFGGRGTFASGYAGSRGPKHEYDPSRPLPPCSYFKQGNCRYGDFCHYPHLLEDARPLPGAGPNEEAKTTRDAKLLKQNIGNPQGDVSSSIPRPPRGDFPDRKPPRTAAFGAQGAHAHERYAAAAHADKPTANGAAGKGEESNVREKFDKLISETPRLNGVPVPPATAAPPAAAPAPARNGPMPPAHRNGGIPATLGRRPAHNPAFPLKQAPRVPSGENDFPALSGPAGASAGAAAGAGAGSMERSASASSAKDSSAAGNDSAAARSASANGEDGTTAPSSVSSPKMAQQTQSAAPAKPAFSWASAAAKAASLPDPPKRAASKARSPAPKPAAAEAEASDASPAAPATAAAAAATASAPQAQTQAEAAPAETAAAPAPAAAVKA